MVLMPQPASARPASNRDSARNAVRERGRVNASMTPSKKSQSRFRHRVYLAGGYDARVFAGGGLRLRISVRHNFCPRPTANLRLTIRERSLGLIARAPDAAASTVNAVEGCGVAQQLLGVARMEQGPSLFEALGCGASGARCRG